MPTKLTRAMTSALNRRKTARKRSAKATGKARTARRSQRPYDATAALLGQIAAAGIREPVMEHRFQNARRWRFDLAWPIVAWAAPYAGVAIEIEGGAFSGGRHTRGAGYRGDMEKYNEAAIARWTVIRVMPEHVRSGKAIEWIKRAFGQ